MKITGLVEVEAVTDVRCDVCDCSTRLGSGNLEYGSLHAHWGYGALHDGERYEVHLCENCFLATLAYLKQERRTAHMFETDPKRPGDDFGLAAKDDFFRESH
ncbi:hypothetical protein MQ039_09955 [Pseudomonas fluorescens]|uniref:Uncharacterized protein n=2 Tax=Pseudomonas fluorescens TaxID=294 RepID=A0ABY1T9T3_PSEFL|nr:hypothetical protein [Pseudomonas fluorescens]MCI4603741.1 hypothetical protein [Pseudomonas fluorescens]PQA97307.1 hypothetical protein B0A76_25050 [Pseudomonas fluorescens]RFP97975.1 hypothetical protein D0N73_01105 [Pseudomonas fluorescens]TWR47944.1 hypothetical protein FIP59_13015 [Pseudomonas fluorescens]SNY08905.1 hypothetical protein SAMN04488487_2077 [Pseudomonas fluorescens]